VFCHSIKERQELNNTYDSKFSVLSYWSTQAIGFQGRSDNKYYSKGYACITSTFTTIIIGIQPRDIKAYPTNNKYLKWN
jgi:hypothetical protein